MKKVIAVATLVLAAGSTAAFAGGAACAEKHTQASYAEMEKKYAAHGWLGVETEKVADGRYAVKSVALGSPAEKAGFQKGDVMVALNGARFGDADKEKVKAAKASLAPGGRFVAYQFRDVVHTLGKRVFGPASVQLELLNVPPMRVYRWDVTEDRGARVGARR